MVSTAGSPRLNPANLLAFLLASPAETVRLADLVAAGFTGDLTPLVRLLEEQGLLVITSLDYTWAYYLPREIVLLAELLKHPAGFTYSCTSLDFNTDFQALDTLRRKGLVAGIMDRRDNSMQCWLCGRAAERNHVWYITVKQALEILQTPLNGVTGSTGNGTNAGDDCHFAPQADKTAKVQALARTVKSAKKKKGVPEPETARKPKRLTTNITPFSHVKTRTFLLLPDDGLMTPDDITLFQETYPGLYLQLLDRIGEHFKNLLELERATRNGTGSSLFTKTSNLHVKDQVINGNHGTIQEYFSHENIPDRWQTVNAFKLSSDQDYFFTSRPLRTAITTIYHAYRQKAKNDALLASIRNH
ncbi:MAG: hypothetical protein ACFFD4_22870, partial [Candidatus Odinarchaeota archaeon]